MLPRPQKVASVLLVILLAHLALMTSPLHASPAHAAHSPEAADVALVAHDANGDCDGACHVRFTLKSMAHGGAAEDCSVSPGLPPRRARVDAGVALCPPLDQQFPTSAAPLLGPIRLSAWPSPAAARALLQIFHN